MNGWKVAVLLALTCASAAAQELDTIAQRVAPCAACHGDRGRATAAGYYPRLAGKPAGYLYNQLLGFRDGRRLHELMSYMVDRQSPAYLAEMARHFAAQDLPYAPPAPMTIPLAQQARAATLIDQGDATRGVPACRACHGARLTGIAPAIPGLLGLPPDYVGAQFGAWRTGTRRASEPDCMARIARALDAADISALAAFLAARPVPADAHPAPAPRAALPMDCGGIAP